MKCQHKTHPTILKRLNRAHGQLSKIIQMIEENRHSCKNIAHQMQAVYKAIGSAKTTLVQDHIEGYIENSENMNSCEIQEMIGDLKEITKYLES